MTRAYIDQRRDRVGEMQVIVDTVKTEGRAMSRDETGKFYYFEKEIQGLDTAIEMGAGECR
jgi:hypothetical protein